MNATGQTLILPGQHQAPVYSFKKELIGATRDFIRDWVSRPHFYGTLTYKNLVGENLAKKIFRKFRRDLAQLYGTHVKMAWGEELQGRGVFHHHFLSGGMPSAETQPPSDVTVGALSKLWTHGISKIEEYVPNPSAPDHGAEFYLAKHENWEVDVACNRPRACKRKGCKLDPSNR